jgi:hypothetical protein
MNITPNTNENMAVQLKVQDYGMWRTAYDGREQAAFPRASRMGRAEQDGTAPLGVVVDRPHILTGGAAVARECVEA